MNNSIGRWPISGKDARKKAGMIKIARDQMLHVIHGETHPIPISLFVSNDLVNMGELSLPSGGEGSRASEPLVHKGDAVFYVISGPVAFFLPDSHEVYQVQEGEGMIIPEGTRYQCINYTNKSIKAIFSISPGL